jgi:capsular polysaccharide transport system ATP-binding protein
MIRLVNVTKYYPTIRGRKYVLRDVSLELPTNCNIGILGRNGMGKSTLLRLMGGIDFPNRGSITREGRISWPMGLVGGAQGSLSGLDNARFVCRIFGDTEEEVNRKIEFIREFSELGDYFDMPVKTYSSGMKARLTFATSLAFKFDLYLVDELSAVGDQKFKQKSRHALEEMKGRSHFIKVSHNMQELTEECDAGILLENGRVRLFEDINEAVDEYQKGFQ